MSDDVATRPSNRFLTRGQPTRREARAIETLTRRREYLREEVNGGPDYAGSSYDRREVAALAWALELVAHIRREGGTG